MTVHEANTDAQHGWSGKVRFAVVGAAQPVSLLITHIDAKRQPSGLKRGDPA